MAATASTTRADLRDARRRLPARSRGQLLTLAVAAAVAAGLLWLAVPRAVAAYAALPGDRIAERLYKRLPVDAAEAREAIGNRVAALRWGDDPAYWSDLSRGWRRLSDTMRATDVAQEALNGSAASAAAAIARAPTAPGPWAELASARLALSGAGADTVSTLSVAMVLGPDWPGAAFVNLDTGLDVWPLLGSRDRALLQRQARAAWHFSPGHYAARATTPVRTAILRAALATEPSSLARFEAYLRFAARRG